jgi:3'-phosphoadenosine 5'-phosphosulfate sulfotransferase
MAHTAISLSAKGGQYSIYDSPQPLTTLITNNTKPNIVDTPLTLIFMMGQGHVAFSLSYNGGEYFIYESSQPSTTMITNDAKPEIVDALLTLIFIMGQGACRYLCVL